MAATSCLEKDPTCPTSMVIRYGFSVWFSGHAADNFLWLEVCDPRRFVMADVIRASRIDAHPHHQQFG
jgi:hypothetical protein